MDTAEFCFWLQGLFELGEPTTLNKHQVKLIRDQLNKVFLHEVELPLSDEKSKVVNPLTATVGRGKRLDGNFESGRRYRC